MKRRVIKVLILLPVLYLLAFTTQSVITYMHARDYVAQLSGEYDRATLDNQSAALASDVDRLFWLLNFPVAKQITQIAGLDFNPIRDEVTAVIRASSWLVGADAPASPKKAINLALGLLLGFGLGIGLASLRKLLDNTVKNEDDLLGTPLLAAIGFDEIADEKPLVTQIGRYAARTEAFRTLRTNLQFLNPDAHPQVIVMTSALPNEGKTTSSINLALSLAQAGAKVILVEADLRRPKVPLYLEMSSMSEGLSDLISGPKKLTPQGVKAALHPYESTGLKVLLAGKVPPNPSELLSSHKFEELIELLRKQFEYVIIDCPPLLPVTDAAIVSAKADGCVLVVHAGVTKRPHFIGSRDAVKAVGSIILGVIINKIPESSLEYEYGYRYGYPRYYGANYRPYAKRGSEEGQYAPSADVLSRQALEENFRHIKGARFKEELKRQDKKS